MQKLSKLARFLWIAFSLVATSCGSGKIILSDFPRTVVSADLDRRAFPTPGRKSVEVLFKLEPSRVVLNQPIIINFSISNNSGERAIVDLGSNYTEYISFMITFPNGKEEMFSLPIKNGLALWGVANIEPGTMFNQRVILNEWVKLDQPGRYSVAGLIKAKGRTANGEKLEISHGPAITFMLEAKDRLQLQNVVNLLFERFQNSKTWQEAADAGIALAYVEDAAAAPYLRRAIQSRKMVDSVIINALAEIGGSTAIETLAAVANEATDPEIRSHAAAKLQLLKYKFNR